MTPHTRRDFLRLACCSAATASIVGGLSKFGLVSAMAQGTTDYKALVCIFLFGGNDANNLIVPIDTAGYTNYQTIRANLAISKASLLPLQVGSQANFGLHPNLPELQTLFNTNKSLAFLTNVGTLVQPTTRQQYQSQSTLPKTSSPTPTSKINGKPRSSPACPIPAGRAKSLTKSIPPLIPPRSFRRFFPSPVTPSFPPATSPAPSP